MITSRRAVPQALEDAVYEAARGVIGDGPLATPALTRAIVDRSQRYTSDRQRLAQPADRRADLAARAAFFTVADAMKIAIPVGELVNRGALPERSPLRVLDVGAGCGAMSLGLAATLPDRALEIVAYDRDGDALAIAAAAMRSFAGERVTLAARTDNVAKLALPTADLVVMGTLLNELLDDVAQSVVEHAVQAIADDGAVIVVEPALRETSRKLHAIRDALIATGAHVFAPCTRRIAPCPALADPSDWCHEDRPLDLPPRTAELARLTHLRDSGMKFSYLVLRRRPVALVDVDASRGQRAWRVVSAARIAKGKHELFGCSDDGRLTLRLLRRNRTPDNRAFERAERGDVVLSADVLGPSVALDAERVEIAAPIELRHPAANRDDDDD